MTSKVHTVMSSLEGKRKRDLGDEGNAQDGQRQEQKKPRPLPFRSSPTIRHANPSIINQPPPPSVPSTLTPAESSEDEEPIMTPDNESRNRHSSQSGGMSLLEIRVTDDTEMDMTVDPPSQNSVPWPPVSGPATLMPAPTMSPPPLTIAASGGRIATPIYGHFASDITMDTSEDTMIHSDPAGSTHGSNVEEEQNWWKKRRLPSPISESEDSDTMLSPKSRSAASIPSHRGREGSSFLASPLQSPDSKREDTSCLHRRNGSYDATTGITTTFSMGYRASCEKCRLRVPGHYAHIIREITGHSGGSW